MTSENVAHPDLERIGVVGGGQMGSGIAEVCARAGREVIVVESSDAAAPAPRERIARTLDRSTRGGRLTEAEREEVDGRWHVTASLTDLADSDLVVEAIAEDEALKTALFTELDRVVTSRPATTALRVDAVGGELVRCRLPPELLEGPGPRRVPDDVRELRETLRRRR